MADTKKKYLDLVGLTSYDEKLKGKIAGSLTEAKEYADGLGVKYDPAGTAATKVQELADGTVKTNTDNITALQGKVSALEAAEPETITAEEIAALFA